MNRDRSLPAELERLVPNRIEKGVYYRLYKRNDGSTRLVWWVKAYDKNSNPIYESSHSSRYEDALKLKKKLIAQIEAHQRSGGDPDSVRISELLDDMLAHGTRAKPETLYIYKLVVNSHLRPYFGKDEGIQAHNRTSSQLPAEANGRADREASPEYTHGHR
jgi:hypothetical protein